MYLIVIAWMYVVLMMSVAEATSSTGTLLGALLTFFLYGVGPLALVMYLLGAPARSKAIKQRNALALAALKAPASDVDTSLRAASVEPDAGGHAPGCAVGGGVAPVRKEP